MHAYICMQIKRQCNELIHEKVFSVGIGGFVIGLGQISFFFSLSVFYIICMRYLTYSDLTLYMYISSDILFQWLNPTQKEILISYI